MTYALYIVVYLYTQNEILLDDNYIAAVNLSADKCVEALDDINRRNHFQAPGHGRETFAYCVRMKD